MSKVLIQNYLADLAKLRQVSGSQRESVVREAFKDLLKAWGRAEDLTFVPEYEIESPAKERRYVDGALLYGLRLPFGYWEAKDERDDLDAEIETKFKRGYPTDNIIFEDSRAAVLIQSERSRNAAGPSTSRLRRYAQGERGFKLHRYLDDARLSASGSLNAGSHCVPRQT